MSVSKVLVITSNQTCNLLDVFVLEYIALLVQ